MSASHKKIADALLKAGRKNTPEDTHLVYVNNSEYDYLTRRSGMGERDPDTGIEHFNESDGTDEGNSGPEGGVGGVTNNDSFDSEVGLDENSIGIGTSGRTGTSEQMAALQAEYEADPTAFNNTHNAAPAGTGFSLGFDTSGVMNGARAGGALTGGSLAGMAAGGLMGGVAAGSSMGVGWNDPNSMDSAGNVTSNSGEAQGSSDSTDRNAEETNAMIQAQEAAQRESAYSASVEPSAPVYYTHQYGGYVNPANRQSQSFTPDTSVNNLQGWQTLGGAGESGQDPYDSVDFLDREKKLAAIQSALMSRPAQDSKTMSVDDYLRGYKNG